jgi:hypothetical protein
MKQQKVAAKKTPTGVIFLPRTKPSQLGLFYTPRTCEEAEVFCDKAAVKDLVPGFVVFHPATSGVFSI